MNSTSSSHEQSLVAKLRAILTLQTTVEQVVEGCLDRIASCEPQLRAWVRWDREQSLTSARELDSRRKSGAAPGGLWGIPLGIKDLFDVVGTSTGCGFSPWESDTPCRHEGPLVHQLRRAGGVLLGKTVTTQFACFDPPPTRNPWNPDRTPGGSSSGSAAAVAVGMCLGALGSQTGGSIIRPASYCGIAGYKPSWGRLSVEGVFPAAPSLDVPGPMARTVHDLWILEGVLSREETREVHQRLEERGRPPNQLGILRGRFAHHASPDCWAVFEQALNSLSKAGVTISEAPLPPSFDAVLENHRTVMLTEIAAGHATRYREFRQNYLPRMAGLVEEGSQLRGVDYVLAREHQRQFSLEMDRLLETSGVVACPATPGGAPGPETTGDPTFNSPFSYCGLPAVTLPMGLDSDGLPLGLQLIGKRNGDRELLLAALWCETVLGRTGLPNVT